MEQDDQLNKLKQIAIDIMKEDSNVVEVKVKKDEISIKRKPKDAGDPAKPPEINEGLRAAAANIPDEYLLKSNPVPASPELPPPAETPAQ
jgi:hypothetical protein